jgi:hypothetical protein
MQRRSQPTPRNTRLNHQQHRRINTHRHNQHQCTDNSNHNRQGQNQEATTSLLHYSLLHKETWRANALSRLAQLYQQIHVMDTSENLILQNQMPTEHGHRHDNTYTQIIQSTTHFSGIKDQNRRKNRTKPSTGAGGRESKIFTTFKHDHVHQSSFTITSHASIAVLRVLPSAAHITVTTNTQHR